MRLISLLLFVLLLAIQYPLWLGKGGWLRVWDLNRQLTEQGTRNQTLKLRNAKLEGEVADLQDGTGAIEERARYELGMVKEGEVFVQFVAPAPRSAPRRRCRLRRIRSPEEAATKRRLASRCRWACIQPAGCLSPPAVRIAAPAPPACRR